MIFMVISLPFSIPHVLILYINVSDLWLLTSCLKKVAFKHNEKVEGIAELIAASTAKNTQLGQSKFVEKKLS